MGSGGWHYGLPRNPVTRPRISLLHIDDDDLWRNSIAAVLRGLPEIQVLESVENANDGRVLAAKMRPEVVLLDVMLPDADGLQLARELGGRPEAPKIIILSVRRDDAVLHAAASSTVAGVVWKAADALDRVPLAVRAVLDGGAFFPPEVREAIRRFRADPVAYFKVLSKREVSLVPLFGAGMGDKDVALKVGLSVHTVRSHRRNIMAKLNVHSTPQLIMWAIQRGFVRPPSDGWVAREDTP